MDGGAMQTRSVTYLTAGRCRVPARHRGTAQQALAGAVGVSQDYIAQIENGAGGQPRHAPRHRALCCGSEDLVRDGADRRPCQ